MPVAGLADLPDVLYPRDWDYFIAGVIMHEAMGMVGTVTVT